MNLDTKYKKPFLKDVIFRIDFPAPLSNLHQVLPESLHKLALTKFPIFEPQQAHSQQIRFEGPDVQTRTSQLVQWVFHGASREKTLTIDANSVVCTAKQYKGFDTFETDVLAIVSELFKLHQSLIVNRSGLRYINVLAPADNDPLSWSKYVDDKMLGIIDLQDGKDCITRAFHILEYNYDGEMVKFQFGISNPDYPAVVRRKEFVLDIDSSHQGALEESDIRAGIKASHIRIKKFFEQSITDTTRELMEPEYNE